MAKCVQEIALKKQCNFEFFRFYVVLLFCNLLSKYFLGTNNFTTNLRPIQEAQTEWMPFCYLETKWYMI